MIDVGKFAGGIAVSAIFADIFPFVASGLSCRLLFLGVRAVVGVFAFDAIASTRAFWPLPPLGVGRVGTVLADGCPASAGAFGSRLSTLCCLRESEVEELPAFAIDFAYLKGYSFSRVFRILN